MTSERNGDQEARGFGLVITRLTKLGGLVLAMKAGFFPTPSTSIELGVAAMMMAGAQGLETFIEKLFGK